MARKTIALSVILLVAVSALLIACSDDEQDKQETSSSSDALKQLDEENQAGRAGQPIPNTAPQVTILSPAQGTVVTSSPLEVSWNAVDQNGDKLMVEMQYRTIGSAQGQYTMAMAPVTPDPKKFSWDVSPLAKPGDYEIMVKVSDGSLSNVAFTRIKLE